MSRARPKSCSSSLASTQCLCARLNCSTLPLIGLLTTQMWAFQLSRRIPRNRTYEGIAPDLSITKRTLCSANGAAPVQLSSASSSSYRECTPLNCKNNENTYETCSYSIYLVTHSCAVPNELVHNILYQGQTHGQGQGSNHHQQLE